MAVWAHVTQMQTSLSSLLWPVGVSLAELCPWACPLSLGRCPEGSGMGSGAGWCQGVPWKANTPCRRVLQAPFTSGNWTHPDEEEHSIKGVRCSFRNRCYCGSVNKLKTFVKIALDNNPLKDRKRSSYPPHLWHPRGKIASLKYYLGNAFFFFSSSQCKIRTLNLNSGQQDGGILALIRKV